MLSLRGNDKVNLSMSRLLLCRILLCGFVLFPIKPIRSAEFPERLGNTEIVYIKDPNVEMALRVKLFGNAEKTIDLITLIQGLDPLGSKMLGSLRRAADRGVKVRTIYDGYVSDQLAANGGDKVGQLLADSGLKQPGIAISLDLRAKARMNWDWTDHFHEKIAVIDAGTPQEVIFVGGRNQLECDLHSRDLGFVIRPINPNLPYIGTDLKRHYERIFETASRFASPRKPGPVRKALLKRLENHSQAPILDHSTQRDSLAEIEAILAKNPALVSEGELKEIQFRPRSTQLITNDVLFDVIESPKALSLDERLGFRNDIVNRVVTEMTQAETMHLYTYLFNMHPNMIKAAEGLLSRGKDFHVYTNGRSSLRDVYIGDPLLWFLGGTLGVPESPADLSYRTVLPLLRFAADAPGRFHFNMLNSSRIKALPEPHRRHIYQHRKMAVLGNELTLIGSDNFTQASHGRNTEQMIFTYDPRMAAYMKKQMEQQHFLFDEMDTSSVARDLASRPVISDLCQHTFRQLY